MAGSKPIFLLSLCSILPFTLSILFMTLALDLDCFPLDYQPFAHSLTVFLLFSSIRLVSSYKTQFPQSYRFSALPSLNFPYAAPKCISLNTSYLQARLEFLLFPQVIQ